MTYFDILTRLLCLSFLRHESMMSIVTSKLISAVRADVTIKAFASMVTEGAKFNYAVASNEFDPCDGYGVYEDDLPYDVYA